MKEYLTRGRAFATGMACLGTLVLTSVPAEARVVKERPNRVVSMGHFGPHRVVRGGAADVLRPHRVVRGGAADVLRPHRVVRGGAANVLRPHRVVRGGAANVLRPHRVVRPEVALSASVVPAPKALLPGSASCPSVTTSQAFAPWGDANQYKLVSGSSFSGSAPGWTLSGGATIVPGGEPFAATGSVSPSSLALPAGASAQSPMSCVDVSDPTWRFFAGSLAGSSSVLVSVVVPTPGLPAVVPVGVVSGKSGWQPSPVLQTGSQVFSTVQGGTAQIALRFTAISGTTNVDDVFIDPRMGWR